MLALAALSAAACGSSSSGATTGGVGREPAAPARPTQTKELPKHAAGGYHLTRQPVILASKAEPGEPPQALMVLVRLNRRLPAGDDGTGAGFYVQGAGPDAEAERYGHASRHCYVNFVGYDQPPQAARNPQDGTVVPLEVDIDGVKRSIEVNAVVHVTTIRRKHALVRSLGCSSR
ncbi:hypothetical protein [Patulibacter sp. SYSU D01012]|uniref:hypothetical protein n=1 Tax=Patulibacter sp. SYSU D01012 TaxID=2817381 RepID=UPI001B30C61E|nr:hypothetical protein [Patulibacter sp. SYSU D01012]